MFGIQKLDNYNEATIMAYLHENLDDNRKATLVLLFGLLEEVVSNKDTNSMTEDNVMRCVSMSLSWSESADFHDLERNESVFRVLMKNYKNLVP